MSNNKRCFFGYQAISQRHWQEYIPTFLLLRVIPLFTDVMCQNIKLSYCYCKYTNWWAEREISSQRLLAILTTKTTLYHYWRVVTTIDCSCIKVWWTTYCSWSCLGWNLLILILQLTFFYMLFWKIQHTYNFFYWNRLTLKLLKVNKNI